MDVARLCFLTRCVTRLILRTSQRTWLHLRPNAVSDAMMQEAAVSSSATRCLFRAERLISFRERQPVSLVDRLGPQRLVSALRASHRRADSVQYRGQLRLAVQYRKR